MNVNTSVESKIYRRRLILLSLSILAIVCLIRLYGKELGYYVILILPSVLVNLSRPALLKKEIAWGKQNPMKTGNNGRNMPNVILIVADDLGMNDLNHGAGVGTPNIDSLRKNGVDFVNAYSGHATCAPSRAALYTGRFATRFGYEFTPTPKLFGRLLTRTQENNVRQPIYHTSRESSIPMMKDMVVPVDEVMLAANLSTQFQYNTYMIGKWHLGETKESIPTARGYDESLSFLMGASKYLLNHHPNVINAEIKNAPIDDFLRWNLPFTASFNNGPKFQPPSYMTDFLSDEAVKLIHTHAATPNANPFFITMAYNAPHNPLQALDSDYYDPELAHISDHNERVYAAMIKALDRGVGKLLESLRSTNQWGDVH
mmetsp:Transcript_24578/g.33707  ORF Transcript_24578/g.33707 Transcript_24578/m.33707 type:complete len:372 (-) Transcript_24578:1143-2258(-)